jgi:thioredoxin 1
MRQAARRSYGVLDPVSAGGGQPRGGNDLMNKLVSVTDATFDTEVVAADGVTVVDFWAAWCGPCRLLGPVIEQLADEYQGRVRVTKVDVDANPGTAEDYGIASIPTILIFRDGAVVQRLVGYQPKGVLASILDAEFAVTAQRESR